MTIENQDFTVYSLLRIVRMVMGEVFVMRNALIAERRAVLIELK